MASDHHVPHWAGVHIGQVLGANQHYSRQGCCQSKNDNSTIYYCKGQSFIVLCFEKIKIFFLNNFSKYIVY